MARCVSEPWPYDLVQMACGEAEAVHHPVECLPKASVAPVVEGQHTQSIWYIGIGELALRVGEAKGAAQPRHTEGLM